MANAPNGTTLFEHLEALGAPPGAGLKLGRAIASTLLMALAMMLVAGACAFAFGPSRTLFDPTLLPKVFGAVLVLGVLHQLAGAKTTRWSDPARSALFLVFLLGALCFLNEAWSLLRRAL